MGVDKWVWISDVTFLLKLLGPPPRPMKYTNDLDSVISDSIWNDVRRAGHDQFSGADYSAGAAHRGMPGEPRNRRLDRGNSPAGGCRVFLRNVLSLGVEIGSGFAKPLNAHGASTS
jgi:hypothetical protein